MAIPRTFNQDRLHGIPDEFAEALRHTGPLDNAAVDALFTPYPNLTERHRAVISLRFGLLDGIPRTHAEVGRHFGVQRERIRQIEAHGLAIVQAIHQRNIRAAKNG